MRILDLQAQKSAKVPGSEGLWGSRWSPDGKHLVAHLDNPARKLMLFTFATNTWQELASGTNLGWECWSRDSKFVYALDGDSLVRVAIADRRKEQIISFQGLAASAWFGIALTRDGRPIMTRNTSIQEIYAFDLEYK